jgi:hypothetical protein
MGQVAVWQSPHGHANARGAGATARGKARTSYAFQAVGVPAGPPGTGNGVEARKGQQRQTGSGWGYGFRRKATRGRTFQAGHHARQHVTWLGGWVQCTGAAVQGGGSARTPPRPRGPGKAARPRTRNGKASGRRPDRIGCVAADRHCRIVKLAQDRDGTEPCCLPVTSVTKSCP